jgi:hypothetical protein
MAWEHVFVHQPHTRLRALELIATGMPVARAAKEIGVSRSTVRGWCVDSSAAFVMCPRCWLRARPVSITPADYAYLLGIYLGDGHITQLARTQRLRISCDALHPRVLQEIDSALRRCFPWSTVNGVSAHEGRMFVRHVYANHLSCLFPQHGPGKKHHRSVRLEPWQEDLVAEAPWSLLRGLIQSDGCAFINRTGPYEYLSYDFSNRSQDILDLFCNTCDFVGVEYRRYTHHVRIYRRGSVRLLEEHVGLKG